ncbi:multifunctional thiamine-phosphate pyrophosphorylase/synthase/phosphomethylpyrimidine kinase [Roseovarius gaetbuli]|uniref:Aminopyrimidine aminohydrolase n=1 Tax=Roseovarius gaetbuli TaxID=1356575 RepID=A0A1X6ZPN6_9RHOB|nr:TenA family protein [Roseovarius gaetbuli]SLN57915.1 multifunctional thiamine-phosphate pyrophosphorylase/synthase/phosphomethylpyrimidine kinase [Roseovarius gaetbuli]
MRPTDHLKSLCQPDWTAATSHAFTNDLVAGTLAQDKMLAYLRQDYLFIEGFVRLLASAIAQAPSLGDAIPAAQFLGLISGPENTYFLRAIPALGGTTEPPAPAHPVTQEFQALMAKAARSGRYEQMLAVLVVAEWSYLSWANPHADKAGDLPFWFGEWISLHSGAGFEAVVAYLRDQLDRAWQGLGPDEMRAVEETFITATRLERAFFDAASLGYKTA